MSVKKELTKEDAIKICYRLWKWMDENANNEEYDEIEKWAWPGWAEILAEYGSIGAAFSHRCPFCEYAQREARKAKSYSRCGYCPFIIALGKDCYYFGYNDRHVDCERFLSSIRKVAEYFNVKLD